MPRDVNALPEAGHCEQARFGAIAKLLNDSLTRQCALHEHGGIDSWLDGVGDSVHHRAIRKQGEGPPTRGADEPDELFDDGFFGGVVVSRGKVLGYVEQ